MATLTKLSRLHGFASGDINTDGYIALIKAFQKIYFADGRDYDNKGYNKLDMINTKIVGSADVAFTAGETVSQATSNAKGIYDECTDVKLTFAGNLTTDDTTPFLLGEKITQANTGAIGYVTYCGMTNDGTNTTGFINVCPVSRNSSTGAVIVFDTTAIVGATSAAGVVVTAVSAIGKGKFHYIYRTTTTEFDEDNAITGASSGSILTPHTADDEVENLNAADYTGAADVDDGSCVQYLYLDGTADGGTMTITYEGTESGDIDYDSTWAEVSTILDTAFGAGIIVAEGQSGTDITDVSASNALILSFKSTQGSVNQITATTSSLLDGAVVLNATIVTMTSGFTTVTAPPHWLTWKPVASWVSQDASESTTNPGIMPDGGSNIGTLCFGRVFLNSMSNPHQWFATRVGDPLDLDSSQTDSASATTSQNSIAGLVGSPITAMVGYKDHYLIMGCANEVWIMRSDPLGGGVNTNVSRSTGFFSPNSWCWDDQNNFYFLGVDGIYRFSSEAIQQALPPDNITKENIPKLVTDLGLNRRTDRVAMEYDKQRYGIQVSVTQKDGVSRAVFWLDLRTGGLFPDSFPTDQSPASMFYYDSYNSDERALLLGGYDGYIRKFDESEKDDEGSNAIESYVGVGPFVADDPSRMRVEVNETSLVTGEDTDGVTIELFTGDSADNLITSVIGGDTPLVTKTLSGDGLGNSVRSRVAGKAIAVKLKNTTASETWSHESLNMSLNKSGRKKG